MAGGDLGEIIGKSGIEVVDGARTTDLELAEMRYIEDPDAFAYRGMFGQDTRPGIFNGHFPAAERGHFRAGGQMPVVQRGVLQGLDEHCRSFLQVERQATARRRWV